MPSDTRLEQARAALRAQSAAFRAAVETARAEMRAWLAAHAVRSDERAREAALELGRFAGGRINIGRFSAVVGATRVLAPEEEAIVRRCAEVMDDVLARGEGLFTCEVPGGGDARAVVEAALAEVGRAFGAAIVFRAVKAGVHHAEQHESCLRAFPFRRWNRGERLIAPPLVVCVDGADLHAAALAEYLDGRQKIVFVVTEPSTPAPLVRLVTPGLFVLQTDAPAELARLAAADGPGVAALLPETAARFVHDPCGGGLEVTHLCAEPRAAVGGWSVRQQQEELAQLRALADAAAMAAQARARAAAEGNGGAPAAGEGDVDAVAGWLLAQAGFAGESGGGGR
ncbi:MAG TPA: hypothetical protein VFS05_03895 [Gemmatimonadaceae bacterium]|nr:hypothetical protein [Gemmatimonadaceae bacterium]